MGLHGLLPHRLVLLSVFIANIFIYYLYQGTVYVLTNFFYIFPEVPGGDGEAFVEKAIKNNLFIVPGSVFSKRNTHVRISFAASEETLMRGIEVLNRIS
jgi:aspartate/methionine/tyrosine aminotransferase